MKKLKENIKNWVSDYIGPDFSFREYQESTIYNICSNILDKEHSTQIIEAPTGSGKSLLLIISAGVLLRYYGIKSYILCSDLFLWKQYDDFIFSHPRILSEFGSIKGQTGNYICSENNEDIRNAKCRIAKVSWSELYDGNRDFPCAGTCRYIQARKKAIDSGVTLMTYQLYINTVARINKNEDGKSNVYGGFSQRPVIFCDECHNIPGIVSGRLSPQISMSSVEHFKALYDYNIEFNSGLFADQSECENLSDTWPHPRLMEADFKRSFNKLTYKSDIFNEEMAGVEFESIKQFIDGFLDKFKSTVEVLQENMKVRTKSSKMPLSKKEINIYKHSTWFDFFKNSIDEFRGVIDDTGSKYLVKYVNDIHRELADGSIVDDKQVVYKLSLIHI